ncbi:MAG: glycosyltransferase family 2 protein [Coriobacteriia bacterium]|nr:glycosyltransferase family 2 protein [Coriobacteriia bacterium]
MEAPIIWFVIPCYNEEQVLPETSGLFEEHLCSLIKEGLVSSKSRICFVNDGSSDDTWDIISELAKEPLFEGISLSRNQGHQNALLAGLMEAKNHCDAAISIDCDGQDDILASRSMILSFRDGAEIVYGVRSNRDTDTRFKKMTAEAFYKLLSSLGVDVVFNHADYRLMSKKALIALSQFKEVNLFLRGLVPLIGLSSDTVEYERAPRMAGESHYPLKKMLSLAIDGITSLSTKPLHLISMTGIIASALGIIGIIWSIATALTGHSVAGWSSVICAICLLGGLQLLCLGVIGEYIGKIYLEVKERPRYLIAERTYHE